MRMLRIFSLELRRLMKSHLSCLVMLLTVLSPLTGLILYKPATASTMLSMYLANPALAGGVAGGILFGLLTVFEFDRVNRSRTEMLIDPAVSPLSMALVRLAALFAVSLLTLLVTMLIWLPVSMKLIGSVFSWLNYILAYLLFMGLALPLCILAASSAYQFTRRSDLSIVLFAALAALNALTIGAAHVNSKIAPITAMLRLIAKSTFMDFIILR